MRQAFSIQLNFVCSSPASFLSFSSSSYHSWMRHHHPSVRLIFPGWTETRPRFPQCTSFTNGITACILMQLVQCDIAGIRSCRSGSLFPCVCVPVVFAVYPLNIHDQFSRGWALAVSWLYRARCCLSMRGRAFPWVWGCWAGEHKISKFTEYYKTSLLPHTPTSNGRVSQSSSLPSAGCGELGSAVGCTWRVISPWFLLLCPWPVCLTLSDSRGVVCVSTCIAHLCSFLNFPFLWFFRCFLRVVYVFWIIILHQLDVLLVAQSCPTLCDPMDCSPPGSSVHRIFQARILDWVALPSSRGSSWRDWTRVSCIVGSFFTVWATWEIRCTVESI